MRKLFSAFAAIAVLFSVAAVPAIAADDDIYKRLALQVSENDPATFNKVLNVASNFSRSMTEQGYVPLVEIITFNAGLHMYRTDTSPVLDRIQTIRESYPDLKFIACGNTMNLMERNSGTRPVITEHAEIVQAGVVHLMELDAAGYFVIRP